MLTLFHFPRFNPVVPFDTQDAKSTSWTPLRFFGANKSEKKRSMDDSFISVSVESSLSSSARKKKGSGVFRNFLLSFFTLLRESLTVRQSGIGALVAMQVTTEANEAEGKLFPVLKP